MKAPVMCVYTRVSGGVTFIMSDRCDAEENELFQVTGRQFLSENSGCAYIFISSFPVLRAWGKTKE